MENMHMQITAFIQKSGAQYPCVLGRSAGKSEGNGEGLVLVMGADELKQTSKDHELFLQMLEARAREKGLEVELQGKAKATT